MKKHSVIIAVLLFLISNIATGTPGIPHEEAVRQALTAMVQSKTAEDKDKGWVDLNHAMISGGYEDFTFLSNIVGLPIDSNEKRDTIITFSDYDNSILWDRFKEFQHSAPDIGSATFFGGIFDTVKMAFKHPENLTEIIFSTSKFIYSSFALILFVIGAVLFVKYRNNLFHDIELLFPSKSESKKKITLIFLAMIFLPLFLTIHVMYLPFFWILLFTPYINRTEIKATVSAILLIIMASGFIFYSSAVRNQLYSKEYNYYTSMRSPFSRYATDDRTDIALFTKGTWELREGNYRNAISIFKEIKESSPMFPLAMNNVGVSYFFLNEYALAKDFFNEAAKGSSNRYEPHFNLAMTHLATYNIAESENEIQHAYDINKNKTIRAVSGTLSLHAPIIIIPSSDTIISRLLSLKLSDKIAFSELFGYKELIFFIILFTAFISIHYVFKMKNTSRACSRCGNPFIYIESQNETHCKQCVTVFVKKDDLASSRRKEKIQDIKKYSKLKKTANTVAGMIIPGFYDIFIKQRSTAGLLILFFTFFLVLTAVKIIKISGISALAVPVFIIIVLIYLHNFLRLLIWVGEE